MVSSDEDRLTRTAIETDARFVVSMHAGDQPRAVVVAGMSITPFYSLFAYEARRALAKLGDTPHQLMADVESQLATSRHTVKLFEDTKRYVEGQIEHVRDTLRPAHRGAFLNKTWLPFARRWETDLGIYPLHGQPFTTTHAIFLFLGAPDSMMADTTALGGHLRQTSEAYGQEFARLSGGVSGSCRPWLLQDSAFDHAKDRRSEGIYDACFNGPSMPDLNAMLTVHLALARLARDGFGCSHDIGDCYTRFKIRFLALYQLHDSLNRLEQDMAQVLTPASQQYLRSITNCPAGRLTTGKAAAKLRNTLMHYVPRITSPSVKLTGSLLDDLIVISGFTSSAPSIEKELDSDLDGVTNELLRWCGRLW